WQRQHCTRSLIATIVCRTTGVYLFSFNFSIGVIPLVLSTLRDGSAPIARIVATIFWWWWWWCGGDDDTDWGFFQLIWCGAEMEMVMAILGIGSDRGANHDVGENVVTFDDATRSSQVRLLRCRGRDLL
ncbi:Hypothetical predicted protein, partial [Olea europaea subsp. europaea]